MIMKKTQIITMRTAILQMMNLISTLNERNNETYQMLNSLISTMKIVLNQNL